MPTGSQLSPRDLLGFLFGRRAAIERAVRAPNTLALGGLLVLTAALAREYDGHDLWAEPWHLLVPFGASLATSALLYGAWWLLGRCPISYPRFLGLYWLTAPAAWLYALPVERWMDPETAMIANLYLLAIVAVWRVILMARILYVVGPIGPVHALVLVTCFGTAVTAAITQFSEVPLLNVMGGVRLSPSEQILSDTMFLLTVFAVPVLLVTVPWLLLLSLFNRYPARPAVGAGYAWGRSTWCLALVVLLAGSATLPWAQPPLQRAGHVAKLAHSARWVEAVAFMSRFESADFPPHWDPPPRVAYVRSYDGVFRSLDAIHDLGSPAWVRDAYLGKLEALFPLITEDGFDRDKALVSRLVDQVERFPEIHPRFRESMEGFELRAVLRQDGDEALQERVDALLNDAPKADQPSGRRSHQQ